MSACRLVLAVLAMVASCAYAEERLRVGSKRFTESYILAEIAAQTVNAAGEDPVTYEAENRGIVYELTHAADQWSIDAIDLLS